MSVQLSEVNTHRCGDFLAESLVDRTKKLYERFG